MNPWSIFEFIFDLFAIVNGWRSWLCFMAGLALASLAAGFINADPLRWIVAGLIVIASLIIGHRWERGAS